ncbi:MAG: hypothetical protein ACYDDV_04540 [Methanoregula sp.]
MEIQQSKFLQFLEKKVSIIFCIIAIFFVIIGGVSGIFIFIGVATFFIFCAIILGYQKNPIFSIVLLCFTILIILIALWNVENQPIYLTVAVTAVMAITTTWYSSNSLRQQVSISENIGKKNYIAEIARSVFSAMQLDLLTARKYIVDGPFFIGIVHPKTNIDEISPKFYLQGNIEIRSGPSLNSENPNSSTITNGQGPRRPAAVLLKVPDDILQNDYLPKITKSCNQYEKDQKQLLESLKSIAQKTPLFWEDFKNYCNSLDTYSLKNIFDLYNGDSPSETFYHYLLRYALIQGKPNAMNFQVDDGGMRLFEAQTQKKFIKYINENKALILNWLLSSPAKDDVTIFRSSLENIISDIDQINDQINGLFLAWKVKYGLTEEEMNLRDLLSNW